jgi:hypothetical protein
MSADSSDQDLKTLWKDQPPEADPMTLEHIQKISRRLDGVQQRTVLGSAAAAAFMAFMAGSQWQRTDDSLTRAALILLALGAVGFLFMVYRLSHVPRAPTEAAGPFLRRRLAEGLRPGRAWLALAPLGPGLLLMIAARLRDLVAGAGRLGLQQWLLQALPLAIVAAAFLYAMGVGVPRARRRIRQRLDELDRMLER